MKMISAMNFASELMQSWLAKLGLVLVILSIGLFSAQAASAQEPVQPEVGSYLTVSVSSVHIRVAPDIEAPQAEPRVNLGAVVEVLDVVIDDEDVWILTDAGGWSAYTYAGSEFFAPSQQAEIEAAAAGQGGGPTFVLNQRPVFVGETVVGHATTPQNSPAAVLIPEGGYTFWAVESTPGFWSIEVLVGNPNDGTPEDLNQIEERTFTGQALTLVVFGDLDQSVALTALVAELFDLGSTTVVSGPETFTSPPTNDHDLNFVGADQAIIGAGGQALVAPYGANHWEEGWQYISHVVSPYVMPLSGKFSLYAVGSADFEVDGNVLSVSSENGTVGNLVVFQVAEGFEADPVRFSNYTPSANSFVQIHSGDETPQEGLVANGQNFFGPPNCGRGCQTVRLHVVYIASDGVRYGMREYTDPGAITESEALSLIEEVEISLPIPQQES